MLLYQPQEGYCYNSDSLFLYDFISFFKPKGRVLDVGAESGVVGLLVARDFPKITLEAVELQEEFAKLAQKNAKENGIGYSLYCGDFLEYNPAKRYDFIVSNPPFYHDGVQKSSNKMLFFARYNVNLPLEQFFKKVQKLLTPRGHFVFCYDETQFALVCEALAKAKLRIEDVQFVHPEATKKAALVLVHARNSSKSLLKVHPPLFNFVGGEFSEDAKQIYAKANTKSLKCKQK